MASYDFGLDGFLCRLESTNKGWHLSAWAARYPVDVKVDKDIANDDVQDGIRPDDRAQVERLFAPLFAELREKLADRQEQERRANADQEKANMVGERERTVANEEAQFTEEGQKAKDGTAPGINLIRDEDGKVTKKTDEVKEDTKTSDTATAKAKDETKDKETKSAKPEVNQQAANNSAAAARPGAAQ